MSLKKIKPKKSKNQFGCGDFLGVFTFIFVFLLAILAIYLLLNRSNFETKKTEIKPIQAVRAKVEEKKETVNSKKQESKVETKKQIPQLQQKNPVKKTFLPSDGLFLIDKNLKLATLKADSKVYGGYPKCLNEHLTILDNIAFVCGYSEKRKNPLWVAYRFDKNMGKNDKKRPSNFRADSRTKSKIKPNSYNKSGFDKGHMAPNSGIALRYGSKAQEETFLMTNIVPQTPVLNRKIWSKLERYESMLANSHDNVWIITGPIFGAVRKFLKNGVEIPEAFYKIIIDEEKDKIRILPFIIPQNVTGKEHIRQFITSVEEIETKTGLDFFAPMNDIEERNMEKLVPRDVWR